MSVIDTEGWPAQVHSILLLECLYVNLRLENWILCWPRSFVSVIWMQIRFCLLDAVVTHLEGGRLWRKPVFPYCTLHSQYFTSDTRCVGFSTLSNFPILCRCQLGVPQFNSVLTLSTWRQQQTPQVKGSVLQDSPTPLPQFRCQSQVQVITCAFEPPATNWRFPQPSPQRTEENILVTRLLVYRKGFNSGTARWKSFIGQGMREVHRAFQKSGDGLIVPLIMWLVPLATSLHPEANQKSLH